MRLRDVPMLQRVAWWAFEGLLLGFLLERGLEQLWAVLA